MNVLRKPLIVLLVIVLLVVCNSKANLISEEQKQAVNNCIEFIKNSSFESKDRINTNIVEIRNVKETWKSALVKDTKAIENTIDQTDWVITIGDTTYHNYATFICDSSTYKVLKYLPTR